MASAFAQTEPMRVWNEAPVRAQYWANASGQASVEAARAAFDTGQGKPADPSMIMPLGDGRAVWYKLELPKVSTPARAVLTVPFPGMDSVTLYRPNGGNAEWM